MDHSRHATSAMMGPELDHADRVERTSGLSAEDLEQDPFIGGVDPHPSRSCGCMPRSFEVRPVTNGERAVARSHELLGGQRLTRPGVDRSTTGTECEPGAARASSIEHCYLLRRWR